MKAKQLVDYTEQVRGTGLLTHTESSLNRGQTGMWRFVVQRSQFCHSHSISPSYFPPDRKSRNPLRCLLLLFAVWIFALSLRNLLSFTKFFLSDCPSLQHFLIFHSLVPADCRLSLSFHPPQHCLTRSVIYEPQGTFLPLSATVSCIVLF